MPLILDGTMDTMTADMTADIPVELEDVDLFGDPVLGEAVVGLGLPPRAHSKQLQQRMDESRARGCCQSIAWSRQGTIASINDDGRSIDLYFLRAHPKDGTWGLSQPTPCTQFGSNFLAPIVHLAWAATGSPELAVVDALGRISLLTFSLTVNRPYQLRAWDSDPADDLHAVVGCYWLPLLPQTKQYNIIHGPAVREAGIYRYESSFVHAYGPYHPNPAKSALLCVTTNGLLKLFYSQHNNKVQETALELESITTSDDLLTHASMCSEKSGPNGQGQLYIALATESKQLAVMQVAIQWGVSPSDKVPPSTNPLNPSMKAKSVAVTSWFQQDAGEAVLDSPIAELSHLEILPTAMPAPKEPWMPPLVLTVRSYLPASTSSYSQELQSIIDRWEIVLEPALALQSSFEQLGSKGGQASDPQALTRLRRLDPVVINKIIVSIQPIHFGKVICIAFSDGSIQYRDRFTFNEIYHEINVNRITTLNQVGFRFPDSTPCRQVAFSPTNCSFVQVCEDGKVKWNTLQYPVLDVKSALQDREYSAIVAGLTTTVSTAQYNHISYDDILATARQFADKPRFGYDWMMEIVRLMKINVDYSEESHHDQLVRNTMLQLCFSILNHMGWRGEFMPRSFCGKFAMLALNVRNIVILITIASNTPVSIKEKLSPLDEPEVVDALAGCCKWAIDLLAYLSDCLFNLIDDPKFTELLKPSRFSEIVGYLQAKNEVALHLLLCSSTRGYLSAACRRLLHLDSLSKRALQYYQDKTQSALSIAYQKMQHHTSSSLVKVDHFDKLLSTLGASIRDTYSKSLSRLANKTGGQASQAAQQSSDAAIKRAQGHCELTLLLASPPPISFLPIIGNFLMRDVPAFRALTDPAKLFFADFAILEVDDDKHTLAARRARGLYVDVFKRVELLAGRGAAGGAAAAAATAAGAAAAQQAGGASGLWRRCVRCSAVMEDIYGHRPGHTFVLAQQRKCSCGGSWGLLPRGGLVS